MSLSWRDRVNILLAPGSVHIARFGKGWSPRAVWSRSMQCTDAAENTWQPALDALGKVLELQRWTGIGARVVVSNHFARYALVPDAAMLRDSAERMAAARHQLQAIYGEGSGSWCVAIGSAPSKGALLASAIDAPFLAGITAALSSAGLRPLAVEPLIASAFNQCRRRIAAGATWLVVAEPGRVSLAYLDRGAWLKLRVERLRTALGEALPALLERSRLADGDFAPAGQVLFVSREPAQIELPRGDWTIERIVLDGFGARQ
ncbi:MAG: hypothetical protein ACKVQU_12240 [Burkholderiales bacterium]